ncbi:MAG: carboxypeptidase regulatory-like domain-containing protein [Phycisphaerales bacterium]|nr:MAG: carboxypeptidase regulatory-like domain-containing protein [Phycisphaerales bacterium]
MTRGENLRGFTVGVCLVVALLTSPLLGITAEELADICAAKEAAIVDITVECEWGVSPAPTVEEAAGTDTLIGKGSQKCIWATKRPFLKRSLSIDRQTIVDPSGDAFESTMMQSYDGVEARYASISDDPRRRIARGTVTRTRRFDPPTNHTPLAFSILRPACMDEKVPLSELLRRSEFVRISDKVEQVNGFNALAVDLLRNLPDIPLIHKQPYMRVCLAVDHDCTPIQYLYYSPGPEGRGLRLDFSVDVQALEPRAGGLWFPSMGSMTSTQSDITNTYKATKITLNQGLRDGDFRIAFPAGTRVSDETTGTRYTVEASQVSLPAIGTPAELRAQGSDTRPSLPITLASAQPGDKASTYHWRIARPHASGIHFGWFTDDHGEIGTRTGEATPSSQAGPIDLKLTIEKQKGFFLLIQEFPGRAVARREHRIELPDRCILKERHLSDPVILTNARYQSVWTGRVIHVHEHGTERRFVVRFVVKVSRADDPTDSFGPPFDPLPIPPEWPFVVTGRVTDGQGRGQYGVTVTAATGIGTLLGGGETITDTQGRYRLRFGPGMLFTDKKVHPLGVGFQNALITVRKPGFREANQCRHGRLAMAETVPDPARMKNSTYAGVVLPNTAFHLDFVLLPAGPGH